MQADEIPNLDPFELFDGENAHETVLSFPADFLPRVEQLLTEKKIPYEIQRGIFGSKREPRNEVRIWNMAKAAIIPLVEILHRELNSQ